MITLTVCNVAEALPTGIELLNKAGVREPSRAGEVVVMPEPVTTIYNKPQERVLLSAVRDANPFFHLAEALWMLAGCNDSAFLNHFVRDFGERFAEPDGLIHGAYGHRWRNALGFDQLNHVIQVLRKDPTSRQCVIQMWDASQFDYGAEGGPTPGSDDLTGQWRDRPCNTHIYLRVRDDVKHTLGNNTETVEHRRVLDVTVCCRSNDIIWGAYGANAVHFSVLQEYLAARIGVGVGRYYQVSNNYHAYVSEMDRLNERARRMTQLDGLIDNRARQPQPLVSDPETFDEEVHALLREARMTADHFMRDYKNDFLRETALPMMRAWACRKEQHPSGHKLQAEDWLERIAAEDWRTACWEWVARRRK